MILISPTAPRLERLLRHLSECPQSMQSAIRHDGGHRYLIAWLCDLFRESVEIDDDSRIQVARTQWAKDTEELRFLRMLATWLLHHEWYRSHPEKCTRWLEWILSEQLEPLSAVCRSDLWLDDPDRREELVRWSLNVVNVVPSGETAEQAQDRLTVLDSLERTRILRETLAAEKRAREVREAMEKQRAMESSSRYGE